MFSGIAQMCTYWHGKNSRRDSTGVDPWDNSFMVLHKGNSKKVISVSEENAKREGGGVSKGRTSKKKNFV